MSDDRHPDAGGVPRLALRREDAAAALGLSRDAFDEHVRPSLPVVHAGTVRLYPTAALAEWLEANATAPMDDLASRRGPARRHGATSGRSRT